MSVTRACDEGIHEWCASHWCECGCHDLEEEDSAARPENDRTPRDAEGTVRVEVSRLFTFPNDQEGFECLITA